MRNDKEYQLCKQVAAYLNLQYPRIIYHFDYAGLNLSKAQAGRMKVIQGQRGWPDLFIAEARGSYHGLFIELKAEGTKLFKQRVSPEYTTPHIAEQAEMLRSLDNKDYETHFAIGFDHVKKIIDDYLLFT